MGVTCHNMPLVFQAFKTCQNGVTKTTSRTYITIYYLRTYASKRTDKDSKLVDLGSWHILTALTWHRHCTSALRIFRFAIITAYPGSTAQVQRLHSNRRIPMRRSNGTLRSNFFSSVSRCFKETFPIYGFYMFLRLAFALLQSKTWTKRPRTKIRGHSTAFHSHELHEATVMQEAHRSTEAKRKAIQSIKHKHKPQRPGRVGRVKWPDVEKCGKRPWKEFKFEKKQAAHRADHWTNSAHSKIGGKGTWRNSKRQNMPKHFKTMWNNHG